MLYEVYTVYKTLPEIYDTYETKDEAEDVVANLKLQHDLDDAYYDEVSE